MGLTRPIDHTHATDPFFSFPFTLGAKSVWEGHIYQWRRKKATQRIERERPIRPSWRQDSFVTQLIPLAQRDWNQQQPEGVERERKQKYKRAGEREAWREGGRLLQLFWTYFVISNVFLPTSSFRRPALTHQQSTEIPRIPSFALLSPDGSRKEALTAPMTNPPCVRATFSWTDRGIWSFLERFFLILEQES